MKNITFLIIAFFTINTYAQLKVVESQPAELIGKISNLNALAIQAEKRGDTYIFTYKDEKFQQMEEHKEFYIEGKEDFESLYSILLDYMEKQPEEPVRVELDEGYLLLKYGKTFGSPYVEIQHVATSDVVGHVQWLNKKRLRNLFGK